MTSEPEIEERKLGKISEKLYNIAIAKISIGEKPQIRTPLFKELVSRYKMDRKNWRNFIRRLEAEKFLKFHRNNYIEIFVNGNTLLHIYNYRQTLSSRQQSKQR